MHPVATRAVALVAVGGGLGAVIRWGLAEALASLDEPIPWGTLLVNVTGCLALGVVTALVEARGGDDLRLFLGVGLLESYTVVSTFSVESVRLIEAGAYPAALGYVLATLVTCVLAAGAGMALARRVLARGSPVVAP